MHAPQIVIPKFQVAGATRRQSAFIAEARAANLWTVIVRDHRRWIKDIDYVENLVTTVGLNKYLDATLKTGLASPAWYCLLTDGTPTVAAGDTMASHAGWTEVTAYDEATREVWTSGTIAAGSVDNSGSPAQFTIDTNGTTTGGVGLCDNSTKGGSTGVLLAVGAFTAGDKLLDDNDTLDVTLTATQAAA